MEIKKSNHANLEKKKHSIFLFSLVIASVFILTAFEWATYEVDYELDLTEVGELVEEQIVTQQIEIIRTTSQPKVIPPITTDYVIDDEIKDTTIFVEEKDSSKSTDPIDDYKEDTIPANFKRTPPTVPNMGFVAIPEVMPVYPGGDEALFKYLGNNTRYNTYAKEIGAEGTIYIQFIVEKDGSVTHATIVKGVEPGLDQNALKAVQNMKRWTPGKQLDQPVRVRLTLPFKYQLN